MSHKKPPKHPHKPPKPPVSDKKQLDRIEKAEKQELQELKRLQRDVDLLRGKHHHHKHQIVDFKLSQLGAKPMAITGVNVGAVGTFQIGLVPPNGVPLQSGPTVTSDDPLAVLSAVDPTTLQFTATVDATDTAASFNVTVAGVNGAGAALSHSFNVPIIAAPPAQITDFSLDQVS